MPMRLVVFWCFWVLMVNFIGMAALFAQAEQGCNLTVRGSVCEHETREPILGATVLIQELNKGVVVSSKGEFEIRGLCHGSYHLEFRCLGYHTHIQKIEVQKNMTELPQICLHEHTELLQTVVVKGSFLGRDIEKSPILSTVLDKKDLDKYQSIALANALEQVAGVNALNTGVGIAKPIIRGMSQNRVRVNQMGIKQEDQQWGTDHGLQIDAFAVENVEIVRGAAALRYGSDAIGGVINLQPAAFPTQEGTKGGVETGFRSNNDLVSLSAWAEKRKQDHFFRLRLSGQNFADYRVPAQTFLYNRYILPIENQRLKNTAGREYNLFFQYGKIYQKSAFRLSVSNFNQNVGLFTGATGIPRAYQLVDDGHVRNVDLPNQYNNHFKVILNHTHNFKKSYLETDIGYQYNLREEHSAPHAHGNFIPNTTLALGLHLQTLSANSTWIQDWTKTPNQKGERRIGLSAQVQKNKIVGYEFLIPNYFMANSGLFWIEERQFSPNFTLTGGLRYDFAFQTAQGYSVIFYNEDGSLNYKDQRSEDLQAAYQNLSGSLGFAYRLHPYFQLKTNIGNVFRTPHVVELTSNGVHHGTFRHEKGDPTLDSERGYQADIVLLLHDKKEEKWNFSLSPFFNYFTNYIFLQPTARFSTLPEAGQVYQYTQTRAVHTGFEAQAEWQLFDWWHWQAQFSYLHNQNLKTHLALPFTPPLQASFEWEWQKKNIANLFKNSYISIEVEHFAAQNRTDRNEKKTPAYLLWHLRAGTEVSIKNQKLDFFVQVQNLTNQKYMNHLSRYRLLNLPEAGRNVSLTLRYRW
jgi:iron complex outermembrane receptor protein